MNEMNPPVLPLLMLREEVACLGWSVRVVFTVICLLLSNLTLAAGGFAP
jgi:hypothetical protein